MAEQIPLIVRNGNVRLYVWEVGSELDPVTDRLGYIESMSDIGGTAEKLTYRTLDSDAEQSLAGPKTYDPIDIVQFLVLTESSRMEQLFDSGRHIMYGISVFDQDKLQIKGWTGRGSVTSSHVANVTGGDMLRVNSTIEPDGAIYGGFIDPVPYTGGRLVESIELQGIGLKDSITTKGGTLPIIPIIKPFDASNRELTWKVDDPLIATITTGGVLKALTDGTVKVTATSTDGTNIEGEITITISGQS